LLASDASSRGSFLKEMAQTITELAFDYLDAPPVVVGSGTGSPLHMKWKNISFPQPDWILDAINEKIMPLKGHSGKNDFSYSKIIALNKEGV
jgi:2-oxoisovalerate dehydrogenase E1 component